MVDPDLNYFGEKSAAGFTDRAAGPVLIFALPATFALIAGLDRAVYAVFDCDLYYIYHALRFNQGLPQTVFDHTGYLYMLVLSWWTSAFHTLDLVSYATVDAIRGAKSTADALAELVFAGRIFSIAVTSLYAILFAWAARVISRDSLLSLMLGILVAASPGISLHAIVLRPELISGLGVMAGFLAVAVAQRAVGYRQYMLLGLGAAAVYLGHMSKSQAIIPALLIPAFGLASAPRSQDFVSLYARNFGVSAKTWLFPLFALFVFLPVVAGHIYGVQLVLNQPEVPLYLWIVAGWIVFAVIAYNYLYRKSGLAAVYALSSICAGLALAYSIHGFHFSLDNIGWSTAFIENMKRFTPLAGTDSSLGDILSKALEGGFYTVVTFFSENLLWGAGRALVFGAAMILAIIHFRRGHRLGALVILGLCVGSLLVAIAFSLRGARTEYDVYFYFMPALAILIGYADLQRSDKALLRTPLLILLIVVSFMHVVGSHRALIGTPYTTVMESREYFCHWQLENAPFFADSVYVGDKCWGYYSPNAAGDGSAR